MGGGREVREGGVCVYTQLTHIVVEQGLDNIVKRLYPNKSLKNKAGEQKSLMIKEINSTLDFFKLKMSTHQNHY